VEPFSVGAVAGPIAKALGDAVLLKGVEAASRLLFDPSWRKTLSMTAAKEAGIPAAAPAVQAWLDRPETPHLLASQDAARNYPRLHAALVEDLGTQWADRTGKLPEEVDLDSIAEALLERVMADFIRSLDPAAAVAIADERSQARHEQIQENLQRIEAILAGGDHFDEELKRLPPIARESLSALGRLDRQRAATLVQLVSDGTQAPGEALRELLKGPPSNLLLTASNEFWLALADLASVYGEREVEATALDRAASGGAPSRARLLARAAFALAAAARSPEAREHIEQAKAIAESDPFVRFLDAVVREDTKDILRLSEGLPHFVHGFPVASIKAIALAGDQRLDEAIEVLRSALAEEPEWSSVAIWLSNCLLNKAEESHGDVARALKKEALQLARRARDLRRRWRGPSGECVEVMARAAISLGDFRMAFDLCLPEGEATPEEAQWPQVLKVVVTLLLEQGDLHRAAELAQRIDSPFHELLARGALAADSGRRGEAEGHLRQALELARHSGERLTVIQYMGTAGIWPLPDFESIQERDPELAAVIEASSFIKRGDAAHAVDTLRPFRRRSSRTARLLATAYKMADQLDNAVRELQDAARYFRDPELTAQAAFALESADQRDQAFNIASRVAYELPPDSAAIPRVRAILFNGFAARRDWPSAEEQARRLLEIKPTSAEAGWGLVMSLFNQTRLQEAWSEIAERRLLPTKEEEARLWVGLASRYASAPDWITTALDLVSRFPDSEQLHALVLFSSGRLTDEELAPETGERVRNSWSAFLERFPKSEILRPQTVGETDAEMLEMLRKVLEPGAQAALEQARAVEDGRAPLGLLATAARRSYTEAWLTGGTGVLQIYIPVKPINDMEMAAAAASLDSDVVVDGSTLALLSLVPDVSGAVLAGFARGLIPMSLRIDAARAYDAFATPSAGMLGWDPEAGRPTMTTYPPNEIAERQSRAKWIEELTTELDAADVREFPDIPDADPEVWSWLASLQLAKSKGAPLYCDDAWVRRLAASIGVKAFGTVDLLSVLSTTGKLSNTQRASALQAFRTRRAVSIPITRTELIDLAASEGWTGGIAAIQLSQGTYWTNAEAGQTYEGMMMLAARHNLGAVPVWLLAGILGATRNAAEAARGATCSRFLAAAIANYGQTDIVPGLVQAARTAAKRVGANDPLPLSASLLHNMLVARLGHRNALVSILALTAQLDQSDARLLRLPYFTPASSV
jgi:tetratricopeptide (TPR) repeat protein